MALVVNLSNYLVARSDLESDLVVARERAIKERKALLSSYLMLAKTAIEGSYGKPDSPEVRQQVKEILRPLRYGSDGYFFVYDYQGNTVLLPTRPEMEEEPLAGQGYQGCLPHSGIIKSAREGRWLLGVLDQQALYRAGCPKLSFNLVLDKYQWVVGTGFYIDDIDNELATLRSEREETMYGSLKTGVLFILVILG